MLDVGCGEQSHVDERDSIAIVGKEKQFAGIFASWITGRGVFQFQEFRGGQIPLVGGLFEFGDFEPAPTEWIGCLGTDSFGIGSIQDGPQGLEVEFAGIAPAASFLEECVESPDIA